MQGIKWRLSFQGSRQAKQLRKIWHDFSNFQAQDKQGYILHRKLLNQFLDGVEATREISSAAVTEELDADLEPIFRSLLKHLARCLNAECNEVEKDDAEERRIGDECVAKVLHVCEILMQVQEEPFSHESRQSATKSLNECMKKMHETPPLLSTLRLLKKLMNNCNVVHEYVHDQGLNSLIELIERCLDPSVIISARNLLAATVISYRGYDIVFSSSGRNHSSDHSAELSRARTMSNSSVGSSSNRLSGQQFTPRQTSVKKISTLPIEKLNKSYPQSVPKVDAASTEQIPLKGFDYAWNVLSEILKNTPLAGTWFGSALPADHLDGSRGGMGNVLEESFFPTILSLPIEDMEVESQRIQELRNSLNERQQSNQHAEATVTLQSGSNDQSLQTSCVVHHLGRQVLAKFSDAITPEEVLTSFNFLLSVISTSINFQDFVCQPESMIIILNVLEKVEENLSLLVSCSNITRAAASGSAQVLTTSAAGSSLPPYPVVDTDSSGSDFAEYHDQLTLMLMRTILNDPSRPASLILSATIWHGVLIKNISFLPFLSKLLISRHLALASVAIRTILCILAICPNNAVCLESEGITESLINSLATLLYKGRLAASDAKLLNALAASAQQSVFILNSNSQDQPLVMSPEFTLHTSLLVESLLVFAACFVVKDASIPTILLWLTTTAWISAEKSDRTNEDPKYRCSNCETEVATRQCLNESCIVEQCFRLCDECDKVFHKSLIKRSHIRMPVVLSKPCYVVNKHFEARLQLEEGLSKEVLPLYRPCMERVRHLYHCSLDIHEDGLADRRQLFLKRREIVGSHVITAVRGMIDDRKAKGLKLPHLLLRLSSLLASQIVQESDQIINMKDDYLILPDGQKHQVSYWSELLEEKDSHYSSLSGKNAEFGPSAPPEDNMTNSRRLILSNIIQIIGRFTTARAYVDESQEKLLPSDHSTGGFDIETNYPSDYQSAILFIVEQGVDALLVHCAIDNSPRTNLSSADRQYIWWLLRETALTSAAVSSCTSEHIDKFLGWFQWILRSDAVIHCDNRTKSTGQSVLESIFAVRKPLLKDMGRNFNARNLALLSRMPSGPPRISMLCRLLVLQEIRLLMCRAAFIPTDAAGNEAQSFVLSLVQLPIIASLPPTPPFSRGSSFDYTGKDQEDWGVNGPNSDRSRNRGLIGPCYTHLSNPLAMRNKLLELGFMASLFDLVCTERVFDMLGLPLVSGLNYSSTSSTSLRMSDPPIEISDLEKEVWWAGYVTLGYFCVGYEPAKAALEDRNALQILINLTMKLANESSLVAKHGCVNLDYERTLSFFVAELCIGKGQVIYPSKPFRQASSKFPRYSVKTESNQSSKPPQHAPTNTKPSMQLFMRAVPASLESDIRFNRVTNISLSSTYYAQEVSIGMCCLSLRPVGTKFPEHRISFFSNINARSNQGSLPCISESHADVNISFSRPNKDNIQLEQRPEIEPMAAQRLGGRRMSRKNISSASVHSMDNESRWELESVGKQSVYGEQTSRGSFNSHQSIAAVLQAFKSLPIGSFLGADTMDGSGHSKNTMKSESIRGLENKQTSIASRQPSRLIPTTYCNSLHQFSINSGQSSHKAIVLFHHTLLVRSGLSSWLVEDINNEDNIVASESPQIKKIGNHEDNKDLHPPDLFKNSDQLSPTLKSMDGYYSVLRKHMELYLPQMQFDGASLDHLNWLPNYNHIEIRDERCFELILSTIVAGLESTRALLANIFCNLLESNPINTLKFSSSRSIAVVVAKLLPYLSDQVQDVLAAVLSNVLAYSASSSFVRPLLDAAQDTEQGVHTDVLRSKVLFIFGKALDHHEPGRFIHMHGGSILDSGFSLPDLHNGASQLHEEGLTISTWVKLGSLGEVANTFLMRVSLGEDRSLCFYLRTVRTSNTRSMSGSGLDMPQLNRIDNWRRDIQLCWCFEESDCSSADESCRLAMINYLLDISEDAGLSQKFNSSVERDLIKSFSKVVGMIGGLAFPHGFVDLPIMEDDNKWHNICIAVAECGLLVYFDSNRLPTKLFSPFGYIDSATFSSSVANEINHADIARNFLAAKSSSSHKVNKEHNVSVAVGGLYNSALRRKFNDLLNDCSVSDVLKAGIANVIKACGVMIAGFIGCIYGTVVHNGLASQEDIHALYSHGSDVKDTFKLGNLRPLVGLTTLEMDSFLSNATSQQSLTQKQALLKVSTIQEEVRSALHGVTVCIHQHPITTDTSKSMSALPGDIRQLHVISPLSLAVHLLGGYKCLFFFLKKSSSHTIGLLRVMESIIHSDEEASIFVRDNVDKALAYAVASNYRLVNTEVLQAFFDMVCSGNWLQIGDINGGRIRNWRPDLLESYMDLVISCVHSTDVVRSALDWIREHCFDSPKLLYPLLKAASITPLLIMLSMWSIGNSGAIDFCPKPQPLVDRGVDARRKKVIFSNQLPSIQLPGNVKDNLGAGEDLEGAIISKYKLQLSCIRLLKLFLETIVADMQDSTNIMTSTFPQEMTQSFIVSLALFSMCCANPIIENEGAVGVDETARKSERLKLQVKKVFGIVPVLKSENIFMPRYWQLSASVACWTEILTVATSRNSAFFLSTLKNIPHVNLGHLSLELMRSPGLELRVMGIRLLIMYLATNDGKVDPKQLLLFERLHGFTLMCKYLTSQTHPADDAIIDGLFSLMFWKVQNVLPLSHPVHNTNNKTERSSEEEKASDLPSQESGSIFQFFGSKDSHQMPALSSAPDLESGGVGSPSSMLVDAGTPMLDSTIPSSFSSPQATESSDSPIVVENGAAKPLAVHADTASSEKADLRKANQITSRVDEIYLHQVLETILAMLQHSTSIEQVHAILNRLQNCFGSAGGSNVEDELEEVYRRNLDSFFNCRDWLLIICEAIGKFRRNEVVEEQESAAAMSMSESESMVSIPKIRRHDSYFSAGESEEAFSATGESVFDELSPEYIQTRRSSLDSLANKKVQVVQLTTPMFTFVRKVIILDMLQKYNSTRRWIELFRLSLPETAQMQEEIVMDIITSMHHVSFLNANSKDQGFHYLKNMGALLDQVLEQMKVSLPFCIAVVGALHAVSYRCSIALRGRIKETALPEVKRQFIVRCLTDVGQDILNRVNSLIEISPSLQAYIGSTENKVISDTQATFLLFGMLEECFGHLETLLHADDNSLGEAMEELRDLEAVKLALEMMQVLISIIQACIKVSTEAKKAAQKLLDGLPADSQQVMEFTFLFNFSRTSSAQTAGTESNANPIPIENQDAQNTAKGQTTIASSQSNSIVHPASSATTPTSSFGWWGMWTTANNAVPPVPLQDVEAGSKQEDSTSVPSVVQQSETVSENEKVIPIEVKANAPYTAMPSDVRAFVFWFCAAGQTPMRADFFARIQKELRGVFRYAEKIRERYSQRLLRYSKSLQDKRAREKTNGVKLQADAVLAHQGIVDKGAKILQRDVSNWIKAYKDRMQIGHDTFDGTEVKSARHSGRDSTNKPMIDSSAVLSAIQLESFKIPEALIDYLTKEADSFPNTPTERQGGKSAFNTHPSIGNPSPLSKIEALNLLIQCFASARHIAEG